MSIKSNTIPPKISTIAIGIGLPSMASILSSKSFPSTKAGKTAQANVALNEITENITGSSTVKEFNPDIYSFRRITVGPMISLFGFVSVVFAILYKPKTK